METVYSKLIECGFNESTGIVILRESNEEDDYVNWDIADSKDYTERVLTGYAIKESLKSIDFSLLESSSSDYNIMAQDTSYIYFIDGYDGSIKLSKVARDITYYSDNTAPFVRTGGGC